MGPGWLIYAPQSGHLPQSRQNIDNLFVNLPVGNSCARYIRMEDIVDTEGQKIQPFLDDTEDALKGTPALRGDRPSARQWGRRLYTPGISRTPCRGCLRQAGTSTC